MEKSGSLDNNYQRHCAVEATSNNSRAPIMYTVYYNYALISCFGLVRMQDSYHARVPGARMFIAFSAESIA